MDVVKVVSCDASECAFNQEAQCHALAITIGGGTDHQCDTYCPGKEKGGLARVSCGVGACKVPACKFNDHLMCTAPGIKIGHEGAVVDCLSFAV